MGLCVRAQGIRELIGALQSRGIAVYLISGGFRELTMPIARELGVPGENVFANRMNWQVRLQRRYGNRRGMEQDLLCNQDRKSSPPSSVHQRAPCCGQPSPLREQ